MNRNVGRVALVSGAKPDVITFNEPALDRKVDVIVPPRDEFL
jgi:hypothetical protein